MLNRQSSSFFRIVVFSVGVLALTLTGKPAQGQSQIATTQQANQPSTNPPALQERHPRYRVMPSDVLAINFPLSPELNCAPTVQPDGYITLPNISAVYVQGLTLPEIVESLKTAYAKILHAPIISVDLNNFQKPQFTVNGQVGKPGQYELRADTTVSEAIAVAGGFLPTAKTQVFFFHRVSADWVEVKKFDLKQVLHGHNTNEDIHLQAGDMIFVPEKLIATFRKYVPYNAGIYTNPQTLF